MSSQEAVEVAMAALGSHKWEQILAKHHTKYAQNNSPWLELILTSDLISARASASISARSEHLKSHNNW